MTPAPKHVPKVLLAAGVVVVIAAAGLIAPSASVSPGTAAASITLLAPAEATPTVQPANTGETTIVSDIADATIGRYGTRTSATFRVVATGEKLTYKWQYRARSGGAWKTISGAKSAKYTAKASKWANGTSFRVAVTGRKGKVISSAARLTVLFPTRTPARDAESKFGLTGLRQGVDLSAYQYTPSGKVKLKAIAAWTGSNGFTILRNGSGARPIKQKYTNVCTNRTGKTGKKPVTEDCAYRRLADAAQGAGLSLGHYWFNGWISTIDTTKRQLFAGGYTPTDSAKQFVAWLKKDGNYTRASTDPLVLDIEAGRAWTKTSKGKSYTRTLRAWKPAEATEFLTTVRDLLTRDGYQANLYVYMSANATEKVSGGTYVWTDVAGIARLWVASWGTNSGRIPDAQPRVGPWAFRGGWSIWQYSSNTRIDGDGVGSIDGDIAMPDAWTPRPVG